MRILMILLLSLCFGLASSLLPLNGLNLYIPGGVLAGLGLIFLIFLRKKEPRLTLIFFGLAIGMIYGNHYQIHNVQPALDFAGSTMEVTGEAISYSGETAYGISVDAVLHLEDTEAKASVYLYTQESLKPGDRFTATLRLEDSNQDGSFYDYSDGIYLYGYGKKGTIIEPCESVPAKYFPKVVAHKLEESLGQAFPEDTLGFAVALTTGNRAGLTSLSKANLKASGIYHALALSGMHLAVLLSLINLLVLKRKRAKAFVGIPICIAFTIITGCTPSMVRAAVMQILVLSAYLFRRERDVPTSLSLALGVLILENPWSILNWGLQLSFLAVIGLTLLSERLQKYLLGKKKTKGKIRRKLRSYVGASLASTGSAMVMTMPLMAVYFGFISLISPVTNILTAPVISVCFGGSILTAIVGLICPTVAYGMGWAVSWGFRYIDWIAGLMAKVPFGQLYTTSVYGVIWLILLYGVIFILAWKGKQKKIVPLCCAVSSFAVIMLLIMIGGMRPSVTALDVGQGQCLLFRSGGATVMVDCGGNKGNAGDVAAEYLASIGETRVDMLILTHYDSDHVGGVVELMQRTKVDAIALPDIASENRDEITALALTMGTDLYFIRQDTGVYFSGDAITIYAPLTHESDNESGLSILVDMDNFEVLVTGDMSISTEQLLLTEKVIPKVDVLIAGHHGSSDSTSEELLAAVSPGYVIISVGENRYGHPTEETLNRIEAQGAILYRTDENGTITIRGN